MALTKIKGAGINISAAEKLYFDGGGTTYIQESADGVLDFYADNVKMLDTTNNITITGELSEYFEEEDKIEISKKSLVNIVNFANKTL